MNQTLLIKTLHIKDSQGNFSYRKTISYGNQQTISITLSTTILLHKYKQQQQQILQKSKN